MSAFDELNKILKQAGYEVRARDGNIDIYDLTQPEGQQHQRTVYHLGDVLWFLVDHGVIIKRCVSSDGKTEDLGCLSPEIQLEQMAATGGSFIPPELKAELEKDGERPKT